MRVDRCLLCGWIDTIAVKNPPTCQRCLTLVEQIAAASKEESKPVNRDDGIGPLYI